MQIIKEVLNWRYIEQEVAHQGWLPENALEPHITKQIEKILHVQIVSFGIEEILLVWKDRNDKNEHDIWCGSIERAEQKAKEIFNIKKTNWVAYVS